ncbi:MAG: hypothetical protein R3E86_19660 [Pseudomonadales bacterium]
MSADRSIELNQQQSRNLELDLGAQAAICQAADVASDRARSADSGRPATGPEAHLEAARRLAKRMRRYPDRSPQQTRAGLAICRHLQALLQASVDGGR